MMDFTSIKSADQYGNTLLHYAAHADNVDEVRRLIRHGYSVLSQNASGLTPLHMAAFGGNVQALEMLLSLQPNNVINLRSIKDFTLLHEAVRGTSIETVKLLVEKGADTNLQDQEGNTPLHLAAHLRPPSLSSAMCQTLLKGGSNPNIKNSAEESFIFAVLRGAAMEGWKDSQLLISLALKHHPDLLGRNSFGLTVCDEAKRISAPMNIIRLIKEKTQEQQNLFLKQQCQNMSQNVTLPLNSRPDESSDNIPIIDVGNWKPGKKIRLFICGHTGVGKTTFANTLKEAGPLARLQYYITGPTIPSSTIGVACSETGLEETSLAIWDFAGQMEYCFTHSLLLSTSGPNTLYCVIFSLEGIESDMNGGQKNALEQMLFWLRFLSITHSSQSKPHVILIGSHLDTLPNENSTLIAKQFYENVMKSELELFSCFQMQFFSLNCRNISDVNAVREPLSKTVSQVLQESTIDDVPEICQLILKQVSDLRSQKVHFLYWKEFAERVQKVFPNPVCPTTLLTAVEYLHNISELLYLPQYFLQGIQHSATATCQDLPNATELESEATSCPRNLASHLIILDLNWLLQDIFGVFGNFALSPASGTNRERWSSEEIITALNLTNGESEGILELLEAIELVFKTQKGDFVVPGWLKKGGPESHGAWENIRGVGYRWNNGSTGLFSHFLVGRLQIQLMRSFQTVKCQFWKQGALLGTMAQLRVEGSEDRRLLGTVAQLRVEVSEDRRNLYMIGSWRRKGAEGDCEGDCYHLLESVGKVVETLLRKEQEQDYVKLHLCPTELRNLTLISEVFTSAGFVQPTAIVKKLSGFSFMQILEAEMKNESLCGNWNIQPWEVLFPQHDTRMLSTLGMNCSTRWLESAALLRLCSLLDTRNPLELNWKRLGELLGKATITIVTEIEEEASNRGLSPTKLTLNKYPVSLNRLRECLKQMEREDCISEIDNMMKKLKYKAENQ
ncbi:uncharacterized protein [Phyllobates terribilis]|uniref:uncharacterized protein n=1 Tax=Phyllobates terribilis TaxID=111132 RepID=UPI003CCB658B